MGFEPRANFFTLNRARPLSISEKICNPFIKGSFTNDVALTVKAFDSPTLQVIVIKPRYR